nr:hypothetical protein [Chromobacterium sp. ASV5]
MSSLRPSYHDGNITPDNNEYVSTKKDFNLICWVLLLTPLLHNWTLKYDFQIASDLDTIIRVFVQALVIYVVCKIRAFSWLPLAFVWSIVLSVVAGLQQNPDQKLINEIALSTLNFFSPIALTIFLVYRGASTKILLSFCRIITIFFTINSLFIGYIIFLNPGLLTILRFGSESPADIFLIRGGRLSLLFSEPSHAGFMLGFLIIFFFNQCKENKWRAVDLLFLILNFSMFLAAGSKMAFLALPASIFILLSGRRAREMTGAIFAAVIIFCTVGYFFRLDIYHLISNLPYELQETFTTRLSFLLSTIEFIGRNPFGYGFSKIYQSGIVDVVCARVQESNIYSLNNVELSTYCSEPGLYFGSKEHLSLMAISFGVFGFIVFIYAFFALYKKSYNALYLSYLTYFMLSIVFYQRFTGINPGVYPLLAMGIILNEKK